MNKNEEIIGLKKREKKYEEKNLDIEKEQNVGEKGKNDEIQKGENIDEEKEENDEIEGNEKKEEDEVQEDKEDNEKNIKNEEEKMEFKIDFYNLKELTYDDKTSNKLTNYSWKYYITCHRPNNPLLDSVFLIPCSDNNGKDKIFNLLSLQITINKFNIYSLNEYNNATENAAILLKDIYNIEIKDKYFSFVLAKEYENSKTQDDLVIFGIPFIFYSTIDNCFLFNNKRRIEKIEQLFNDEFEIYDNKNTKELLFYKSYKLNMMGNFLERKRKREKGFKIAKNLFDCIREKLFKEKGELALKEKEKNDIIEIINNSDLLQNKKITIKYAFRIKFRDFYNLYQDEKNKDLLGICFYQSKMLLINYNLDSKITIIPEDTEEEKVFLNFSRYMNKYKKKNDKESNNYSENISSFDNLMKYNQNKPSDIFVFKIYEMD